MSTLEAYLPLALNVLRNCKQDDDNSVYDALIEAGIDKETTLIYWYFLPITFGRYVLRDSGVRFSETFECRQSNETCGPFSLASDPRFSYLARAVPQQVQQWNEQDIISVAQRSSEYKVANALKKGADNFKGICLTPPLFVNPTQHFLKECVRDKKWWEFWR